jgi:glycosyltransferase involved in cell wall biosynthesis
MTHPFFSIIIPTRQRHDTLPFSIKTVLCQDFLDYELIIFDNCSSPETHNVVKSFQDDRIMYFRSNVPLAMSDSWETAISKASGQYIILFGDDDGLIKGSLKYLFNMLQKVDHQVIRWDYVRYNWPCVQPTQWANHLLIPLTMYNYECEGKETISQVLNFSADYTNLPMLYNSVVSKKLLDNLKSISGRIFCSITPDVYSGFAIAYLSKKYLSLRNPITINGGSKKSNGISYLVEKEDNNIIQDFESLNQSSELSFHKDVPYVRSIPGCVYECFLQMQEKLGAEDIKTDKARIYNLILSNTRVTSEQERKRVDAIFRDFIQNSIYGSLFHKYLLESKSIEITNADSIPRFEIGIIGNVISVDASKFNLSNILDVSEFIANFYDFENDVINIEQPNNQSVIKKLLIKTKFKIKYLLKSVINKIF